MSITMSRTDKATVFTVTSDPDSRWPLLCQVLKSLCCSPVCCSVSQQLKTIQGTSLSILGAIQIMIGLLNIGFGVPLILVYSYSWFLISRTGFPFWMGSLFIVFGIVGILSEKYPSPCLVIISVILNLAGVGFATAAIVLYSNNIAYIHLWYNCDEPYDQYVTTEDCEKPFMTLQNGIIGVLIVLSVTELCVVISSAVLGIKALRSTNNKKNESCEDPEQCKPLLEDIPPQSAA
ncbi:membrane-spanning 4-domains subfamily A member 6C-like [Anableps anableps]